MVALTFVVGSFRHEPVLRTLEFALIVVYGFLVPAIGWELALLVWGWALVVFVVTDFIKVPIFKRF